MKLTQVQRIFRAQYGAVVRIEIVKFDGNEPFC
jgi:hypothetical protein